MQAIGARVNERPLLAESRHSNAENSYSLLDYIHLMAPLKLSTRETAKSVSESGVRCLYEDLGGK